MPDGRAGLLGESQTLYYKHSHHRGCVAAAGGGALLGESPDIILLPIHSNFNVHVSGLCDRNVQMGTVNTRISERTGVLQSSNFTLILQ